MEFVVHLEWVGKYSISVEFQSAGGWFTVRRYHPSSGWIHEYRAKDLRKVMAKVDELVEECKLDA